MSDDEPVPQAPAAPMPPKLPGFLTWLARHGYVVIALVCLALWLPGILRLPALDRDESRFVQSSRQMLDSGNYVDIRFGQLPRYKKPAGIYWLQSATTAIASPFVGRGQIWTYRLASLLGGTAAALATFWAASLFGAEAGLIAGLLLSATLLLAAESIQATTDAALLATITFTQGVMFRLWRAAREDVPPVPLKLVMAGWAAMGLGILFKGPVAPGVVLATLVLLLGWEYFLTKKLSASWLTATRPLRGIGLLILITAPWLIAIALQSHGAFFQQSLGGDFASKVAEGQEGHGFPPGYYVVFSTLTFWPAILFIPGGIGWAFVRRAEAAVRFLIAWAGGWWLVVELVPTKLPNYVLPGLPPLCILAALWVLAAKDEAGWRRYLPIAAAVLALLGLSVVSAAPFYLQAHYSDLATGWPLQAAVGIGAILGIAGIVFVFFRRLIAFALMLAAAVILIPTLTGITAPSLTQIWLTPRLAQAAAKLHQPYDPPPALAGYEEPSMMFALGMDVALTDGRGAAELGLQKGGLALVNDAERPAFLARLAELQGSAEADDAVSGFNYSRGRIEHITLYRIAPLEPQTHPLAH